MPVFKVYLDEELSMMTVHKYATPKWDTIAKAFAAEEKEAKASGIHRDRTYKVSSKPFTDATKLVYLPKKDDHLFHYYRKGRCQATLPFCAYGLRQLFGEVPAFIYFKEVGEGNKL